MAMTRTGWTLGAVAVALAASLSSGCAAETSEPEPTEVTSELKTIAAPPTMTCTYDEAGCAPTGYRLVKCSLKSFKANSYVAPCVTATCPAVYGPSSNGENCYAPQKIQTDGTWQVWFPLAPNASYEFSTYSVSKGAATTTVLARTSAKVLSSEGLGTDCGGPPQQCSIAFGR